MLPQATDLAHTPEVGDIDKIRNHYSDEGFQAIFLYDAGATPKVRVAGVVDLEQRLRRARSVRTITSVVDLVLARNKTPELRRQAGGIVLRHDTVHT